MMQRYEIPNPVEPSTGFWQKYKRWLIALLVIDVLVLSWCMRRPSENVAPPDIAVAVDHATPMTDFNTAEPIPPPGLAFGFPTAQRQLLATNEPGIYMPTASGRMESALYGSVRTTQQGKYILPSFHEGLDIAPLARDRKQMPTDPILAAAEGRVAHINRIAGNSNYGKYVVLTHPDPLGDIYTLYAHLADVTSSLKVGAKVERGETIGLMGNTASTGLPVARAHLHFEVGLINNNNFHRWYKAQKLKPDHGNYHGHNLTGISPLDMFQWHSQHGRFSMGDYLATLEPAFDVVVRTSRLPEYFSRYPDLWQGDVRATGVMVLTVSEGGVIQRGRAATDEERKQLGNRNHAVLNVNTNALGRNGLRLITKNQSGWVLGQNGQRWLEIITYH